MFTGDEVLQCNIGNHVIETEVLSLLPLRRRFLSDIHRNYTAGVARFMYTQPGNPEDVGKAIDDCLRKTGESQRFYFFAILHNESAECVGGAGLRIFEGLEGCAVQPRFWLKEALWFKGHGTTILTALKQFIFATIPCDFIYATVQVEDIAARRVLEKTGATQMDHCFPHENALGKNNLMLAYRFYR